MADDSFWSGSASSKGDSSYAELSSGGVVRAALYSTMRMPSVSYRATTMEPQVARSQVFATVPVKVSHSPTRLAAPARGKLMLRNPRVPYKATGFMARPSKAITAGAATLTLRTLKSLSKMPDNFCYTPQELTSVRDQKSCGCCWAVSSTSMIADRVMVKNKIRCALSAVQFMECSNYNGSEAVGCEGNDPFTALQTLKDKPMYLKAESKYPRADYTQPTKAADCSAANADDGDYGVTASDVFMVTKEVPAEASDSEKQATIAENVENMKQSLFNEGPLVVVFAVPDDFSNYDGNTIYQPPEGFDPSSSEAWHAVEMVGWGKDATSGQSYWVCRNSWGSGWPVAHKKCNGMGFFYIAMGTNACNIESYAAAVTPKVVNSGKAPKSDNDVYPGESVCTTGRGFWSTPIVGNITWGEVIIVAAICGAGYYAYKERDKLKALIRKI